MDISTATDAHREAIRKMLSERFYGAIEITEEMITAVLSEV